MSNLQRTIDLSIKVGTVERTYRVNFPTVGQYIQIEARKAQLTIPLTSKFDNSTQYLNMIRQGTIASNYALDLVDMISCFEVLVPALLGDIKGIESIENLDILDAKPLLDTFNNVFKPWKKSWENLVTNLVKEEDQSEEKEKKNEHE